jgi:hypothetical protein
MGRQVFDTDKKYEIIPGFSSRLNELLDKCGYSPSGEGRGRELIAFFNVSKGSASSWLTKDKPPVWSTLNTLVEKLIDHHQLNCGKDRVVAWLLHSNSVIENPLESAATPRSKRLLDALIYAELDKVSTEHGVDIYSFDNRRFSALYDRVLAYFTEHHLSCPEDIRNADRLILAGLLLLAQGSSDGNSQDDNKKT